ncbi:DUF551 domain-containing protein [Klebsiella pneumoniae]|uniref:DUF551 domain-containing protein n=1 Tax=Klebsiella pneumoniae TaxID=573 RepID=UPI0021D21921|nr:DUF551 domain-containing protein [Klebsiella pneumoniae]
MTKSTITRERLEKIKSWRETYGTGSNVMLPAEEAEELACLALAAMDGSESVELPLDYLQGHKDGLEWAARLAEANHPDTGDWLYDDPIELAKAIRKGPDMPPVQPVADSEPVIVVGDDGGDALSYRRLIQSFEPGTKLYRHAQPEERNLSRIFSESYQVIGALAEALNIFNELPVIKALDNLSAQELIHDDVLPFSVPEDSKPAPVSYSDFEEFWSAYIHPLAQDDELKDFAWDIWNACRAAMLQAGTLINEGTTQTGNSPVIPDGWTCNDKANAALMMLDRIETADPVDDDRIDGIKRIVRELAAAPHDTPALNSVQSVVTVPGKWIPVSERMPDREVDVQVYCPDKKEQMVAYLERNELDGYFRFATWRTGDGIYCQPTHWMQLPAGPQEAKGE